MRPSKRPEGIERALVEHARFERAASKRLSDDYLAFDYRNFLYGDWRHPKGHIVTEPHWGALTWHEANKALFCPVCRICKQHNFVCKCGDKADYCWTHIGQAPLLSDPPWHGEGEDALRTCPVHGTIPWRKAIKYDVLCAFPGNGWAKTTVGCAEFCSWLIGHRPWDGSLTTPPHSNWLFLIIVQTLSTSAKLNIQEKLDTMLGPRIVQRNKNSSGGIDFLVVETPWGHDRVKLASQDQHARTAAMVSPLEGTEYHGAWCDEPIDASIRGAYGRGLRAGLNHGWGKEMLTATFFEGKPEQRAYIFDEFWNKSFRRGGPDKELFVMSGSIHDNPALTGDDKRKLIAKYPPHEREARTWGIYEEMAGRLLPDFTTSVHVWDDRLPGADVLIDEKNEPSAMPIGICVDPHPVRPWQITAFAVGPDERWYVVREWPEGDYSCMSHFKAANVDGSFRAYADVIKRMVASIPGADWQTSRRIGWWLMDPAAGDMEAVGQGKTVATAMRDFGLYFRTDKIKRDVAIGEGILRKKIRGTWTPGGPVDYLHRPEFMVALSCPNTWRAAMRYAWDETRNRPGEDGKDQIDVARYFAVTEPLYFDWRFQGQKAEEAMEAHVASMRNMGLG